MSKTSKTLSLIKRKEVQEKIKNLKAELYKLIKQKNYQIISCEKYRKKL